MQYNELKLNAPAFVVIQDIEVIGRWQAEQTPIIKRSAADGSLSVVDVRLVVCLFATFRQICRLFSRSST